mmetsp:Transcript_36666/g.79253  ORF Transcript_36666/g.79253 Transcript_36666/m.79253 type:complete len:212 (+) Transcript_36666:91-726(+)
MKPTHLPASLPCRSAMAAARLAPALNPPKTPSSSASARAAAVASSSDTVRNSSMTSRSSRGGSVSAYPPPCILCFGFVTGFPEMTAAPSGSTRYVRSWGFTRLSPREVPQIVPNDPPKSTNTSRECPDCSHSSGAVPDSWAVTLPESLNWSARKAPSSVTILSTTPRSLSISAPVTCPGTPPSACSTTSTCAPKARIITRRSSELPALMTA